MLLRLDKLCGSNEYFTHLHDKDDSMKKRYTPPEPVHVPGIHKGEEYALNKGHEDGRGCDGQYRSARDSTSINPESHGPIHPAMPSIPPA